MESTTSLVNTPQEKQKSTPSVRVRPDLNLEKWSIWQPSYSSNKKTRTLKREIEVKNGDRITSEVTIGYVDRVGTITTEDQKTFYALLKIWEDKGRPADQTYYSLRRVAKVLKKKWGSNVITATSKSLVRLRAVPLICNNSYYDSTKNETIEALEPFNILSDLKVIKRKIDGHTTREEGYFRFNDIVVKNILNNYSKPILLDVVLTFQSEIAQLLYTHLDLIMHRRNHYERNTRALFFDDLGLVAKEYTKKSSRVRKLRKALKELLGVRLSGGGTITTAKVIETNDKHDYKMVIRKNGQQELPLTETVTTTAESREVETESQENAVITQACALVNHFSTLFHNTTQQHLSSKAISQATALIANHGIELAKYIIDFAHREAEKTNYHPQSFGGILQYSARAAARYDNRRQQEKKERTEKQERALQERYVLYRAGELDRIKATILPDELADIKKVVRAEVEAEGGPDFTVDTMVRVRTETILLDRLQLPSFDEWKAGSVPVTADNLSPHK